MPLPARRSDIPKKATVAWETELRSERALSARGYWRPNPGQTRSTYGKRAPAERFVLLRTDQTRIVPCSPRRLSKLDALRAEALGISDMVHQPLAILCI